jgi:hypothetical protein
MDGSSGGAEAFKELFAAGLGEREKGDSSPSLSIDTHCSDRVDIVHISCTLQLRISFSKLLIAPLLSVLSQFAPTLYSVTAPKS